MQDLLADSESETGTDAGIDEDGYPLTEEYQGYKRELRAIAEAVAPDSEFETEYRLSAKGYPYAVISRQTDESSGESSELHLVLNESFDSDTENEYVLEEYRCAADGAEAASVRIVDFYLVDCSTLEVTDEQTDIWH